MSNLPPFRPLFPATPPKTPTGSAATRRNYAPPTKSVSPIEKQLNSSPIPLLHPPKVHKATVPKDAAVPAQLPATSGKTTVPARSVTPRPAPTTKTTKPVAPTVPSGPNLHGRNGIYYTSQGDVKLGKGQTLGFAKGKGYYAATAPTRKQSLADTGSTATVLTPAQAAEQAVTAALAPLYAANKAQTAQQSGAIADLTKSVIAALMPGAAQIGGEYDRSIGQQTNLSNSAADALRAANPNTQDQALLSAINAPQAQQAQLAGQNNAVFNGGAAVGQYVGGVLPMSSLQSQKLAAMGLAHQMPAIEGLRGQQALSAALLAQGAERAKIDAMRPDLIQRYTAANVAAQQKDRYLNDVEKKLGITKGTISPTVTKTVGYLAHADGTPVLGKDGKPVPYSPPASPSSNNISPSVSKTLGYVATANGTPVMRNGKIIPVDATGTKGAPKVPTASQIAGFVDKWKTGKTQSVTTIAKDKDGNIAYDMNGAPKTTTQTVEATKPLQYGQAYRRLRAMGLGDRKARSYLNTAYQKGEQGRAWLTNEQRSALQKAGRQTRVGFYQGHAFIALPQAAALKNANKLPPGELVNGRYFIAPGY
jgi:hypothetical protein